MSEQASYKPGGAPDEGLLMKYLRGEPLSPEEEVLLKTQMEASEFEVEAMEGLREVKRGENIPSYVNDINQQLKHQLQVQGRKKRKISPPSLQWILFAVFLVLILIFTAYAVIHFLQKEN